MSRVFTIAREMSRREVEQQKRRFTGVTVTAPQFKVQDDNGLTEWVCDVRVGVVEGWAVVKDCLISQWATGIINDINIPVTCERSEAGRVTIIARSEVTLPDIRLDVYSYEELGFAFMRNLLVQADGSLHDGFGYEMAPPGSVSVETDETDEDAQNREQPFGEGPKNRTHVLDFDIIQWGSGDFEYGTTHLGERKQEWI